MRFVAFVPPQLQGRGGEVEVRLDAVDGSLVGETDFIQAAAAPTPIRAALEPTTGMHDVYFVFTNDQDAGEGSLFALTTAEFVR